MKLETKLKRFHKYAEPKLLEIKAKLEKRMSIKKSEGDDIIKIFNEGRESGLQTAIDFIDGVIDGQRELREIHFGKK